MLRWPPTFRAAGETRLQSIRLAWAISTLLLAFVAKQLRACSSKPTSRTAQPRIRADVIRNRSIVRRCDCAIDLSLTHHRGGQRRRRRREQRPRLRTATQAPDDADARQLRHTRRCCSKRRRKTLKPAKSGTRRPPQRQGCPSATAFDRLLWCML